MLGKMRRTGSAPSNSWLLMTQRLGFLRRTIIGYLCAYAHLANTRSLALIGDPDASAYEILFSVAPPEEKDTINGPVRKPTFYPAC
jgi:hypothetical protein